MLGAIGPPKKCNNSNKISTRHLEILKINNKKLLYFITYIIISIIKKHISLTYTVQKLTLFA